jgi:methylaspartate ammonia-lyase
MTHITKILAVPATGAYYYEDLTALQAHPLPPVGRYTADPVTEGFGVVREVSEAVSVGLVLDDDTVAWGDCVAVAYSGKAGRAPIFRTAEGLDTVQRVVAPALRGRALTGLRELAAEVDALTESVTVMRPLPRPEQEEVEDLSRRKLLTSMARLLRPYPDDETEGGVPMEQVIVERQLHPAIRYGVSQALLKAVAMTRGLTMAEVIAQEWDLPRPDALIPIHAQSGGERFLNADKMIVRRVASLPHALVDNIPEQLGDDGLKLTRYVNWLKGRIEQLGGDDYHPTIHLDVHGALGQIFENDLGRVLGKLYALEYAAQPYPLRVECPVMLESRQAQIKAMKTLRNYIRLRKMSVELVADEWANTLDDIRAFIDAGAADMIQIKMPDLGSVHNSVEAVLACQAGGVGAFLGGSCAETDLSARVAVHVALATRPDIIMAKPGMGVDEGVTIVQNEMTRTLAWIRAREA